MNQKTDKNRSLLTGTCLAAALLCMPTQSVLASVVPTEAEMAVSEQFVESDVQVQAAETAPTDAADIETQTADALSEAPVLEPTAIGYDSVAFTWSEQTDAVRYEVQQSTNKKKVTVIGTVAAEEEKTFTASELYTAKTYYFRVKAVDADGNERFSEWLKAKTALAAAQIVSAESGADGQARISWTAVEGADFYRVYRSKTSDSGYTSVKTVYETSYIGKMSADVTYYYKILPMRYNPNGKKVKGTFSEVQSLRSTEVVPVIQSVSTAADNGLTVTWNGLEDAERYAIYRSTEKAKGYELVGETDSAARSWTDSTVSEGTKYFYKVSAGRTIGGTLSYGSRSRAVSKWTKSPVPTGLKATQNDSNGIHLSWSAAKAATSYNIYRSTGDDETYEQIAKKVSGTTYTDSALVAGETYKYCIESVHGSLVSEKSTGVSVQIGSLKVSTRTLYLGPGVTAKLTAGSDSSVIYKSENTSVAKVSKDGTVTGVAPGKTKIDVTINAVTTTVTVTVTDSVLNGIDVSRWQQAIDWKTVKASGIKFAMLRLSYGTSKDIQFENYYKGATEQGIPVGVYCYSRAKTVAEGKSEAQNLIKELDGRELGYPVALDLEDNLQIQNMTTAQRTELILAYKKIVEAAGYDFIVYSNLNWLNNYIDQSKLESNDVDIWLARYRSQSLGTGYTGGGNVRIWQYSDSGQVDGILDAYGRYINVDLDVCYDGY